MCSSTERALRLPDGVRRTVEGADVREASGGAAHAVASEVEAAVHLSGSVELKETHSCLRMPLLRLTNLLLDGNIGRLRMKRIGRDLLENALHRLHEDRVAVRAERDDALRGRLRLVTTGLWVDLHVGACRLADLLDAGTALSNHHAGRCIRHDKFHLNGEKLTGNSNLPSQPLCFGRCP